MSSTLLDYNQIAERVAGFHLPPLLIDLPWMAVSRGGLPFATMLAIKYNKRFGVIDPHLQQLYKPIQYDEYMVIDDVIGTGRTWSRVQQLMGHCKLHLCLLIDDPEREIRPDVGVITTSDWLELPWEPNGI